MKPDTLHILLVNPWIHDFAAYDFWAKPLGLLSIGSILRSQGATVAYIDCLDRFASKEGRSETPARYGRGPYRKTPIPKPSALADIPRRYSRYGISPSRFRALLAAIARPDIILVTSGMTYWYPGVQETIETMRDVLPGVPIVLGGIYATLCSDHARDRSGADIVVPGPADSQIVDVIHDLTGRETQWPQDPCHSDNRPFPAHDLQSRIAYLPLITSTGCPFSCDYCASRYLNPHRIRRRPKAVVEEIRHWNKGHGIRDFVFYDDALLTDAEQHAVPLFRNIDESGMRLRFHTPNALHVREITDEIAHLMHRIGFKTIRLGLETMEFAERGAIDRKVTESDFRQASESLKKAGFRRDQIGAYLLAGLPGQSIASIEASIRMVLEAGITPVIAHYSPIPHTRLWDRAVAASRYDLAADPIYTNNAISPCQKAPFSWDKLTRLKTLANP